MLRQWMHHMHFIYVAWFLVACNPGISFCKIPLRLEISQEFKGTRGMAPVGCFRKLVTGL